MEVWVRGEGLDMTLEVLRGNFELWDEAQKKRFHGLYDAAHGRFRSQRDALGTHGQPSSNCRGGGCHGWALCSLWSVHNV